MMLNLADYEAAAEAILTPGAYAYYAGGAADEITLRDNRDAWHRQRIAYHVMRPAGQRTTGTALGSLPLASPIIVAPSAYHGLAHPEAEAATARAAAAAGTLFVASTLSNQPIEAICQATDGPVWLQVYLLAERDRSQRIIERAVAAGVRALVLTVDAPYLGPRERDKRVGFSLPPGLRPGNLLTEAATTTSWSPGSSLATAFGLQVDPDLSWADIAWLHSISGLPVWVKGLVRADDAREAIGAGVAGIWVSNHGGHQLDTAIASADALPAVAAAVAGRLPLIVDGGVRRGTDVLKAIALGATAVGVGRPVLWGLAVDGQAGVEAVLALLQTEFALAMALAGARSIDEITPDLLVGGAFQTG